MAKVENDYSSGYLFAKGTSEDYLEHVQSLVHEPESGVHFVFPLVGAWDSMTVLDPPPDDLQAIRRLVTELIWSNEVGSRVLASTLALPWPPGRIKKLELPSPFEAIVAIRTRAGLAQQVLNDIESELSSAGGILPERVNGSYDLVCELWAEQLEPLQNILERLRAAISDRGTVDVSYASFQKS
jgi:hypothetical protein